MSLRKDYPLNERAGYKKAAEAAAAEAARLREESKRLRAENAGKPGYDDDGNLLTTDDKANRNALTIQKLFQQAQLGRTTLQIVKGASSIISKGAGSALSLLIGTPDRL